MRRNQRRVEEMIYIQGHQKGRMQRGKERKKVDYFGDSKLNALLHSASGTLEVRVLTPIIPPFEMLISSLTTDPGSRWESWSLSFWADQMREQNKGNVLKHPKKHSFPGQIASSPWLDSYLLDFLQTFPNNFLSSLQVLLLRTTSAVVSQARLLLTYQVSFL